MPSPYVEGLWVASALSLSNVITDVFRKKALSASEFYSTSFWMRLISLVLIVGVFSVRVLSFGWPSLHEAELVAGVHESIVPLWARFIFYFAVDVGLVAAAQLLYLRALQFADISYFLPFVALTPVMLIPSGFLLVGEMPLPHQIAGVLLIVAGSLAMNTLSLQKGIGAILRAPFEHKASRYALFIAFLFAISNPVDKIVVGIAGPIPYAVTYNFGLAAIFGGLALHHGGLRMHYVKGTVRWIVLGGAMDALTLLLQFMAYRYLDVVLVIGLKRAGIIVSVLAGWLIFRERGIKGRLYATAIMATGLLLIYMPLARSSQGLLFCAGIAAFLVRLKWRGPNQKEEECLHEEARARSATERAK